MGTEHLPIRRLAIFGVGLIGGSLALALKKVTMADHIIGVGRSQENLERALALGAIDEIQRSLYFSAKGYNSYSFDDLI